MRFRKRPGDKYPCTIAEKVTVGVGWMLRMPKFPERCVHAVRKVIEAIKQGTVEVKADGFWSRIQGGNGDQSLPFNSSRQSFEGWKVTTRRAAIS